MSNINNFPIDSEIKQLVTNLVADYMERMGHELNESAIKHFEREFSEELIENILGSIVIWETRKLN